MGRFLSLTTALLAILAAGADYQALPAPFQRPAQGAVQSETFTPTQAQAALSRLGEVGTVDTPTARYAGHEETKPLTASDYLALLKTLDAPRHRGPRDVVSTTAAGPGRLALSRFFPADAGEAQFWIEATIPDVPNLALLPKGSVEIEIEHVQRADGADIYARESRYEKGFFKALALEQDRAAGMYSGVRAVRVAGSASGRDIGYVTGWLALRLPLETEVIALGKDDAGVERVSAAEASVQLIAIGGGEVAFRTTGRPEAYVAIYAYDREGRRLALAGEAVRANGPSADRKALFHGEVARVEIIFTRGYMRKTYPFVLKGAGAPRPFTFGPPPKASAEPVVV